MLHTSGLAHLGTRDIFVNYNCIFKTEVKPKLFMQN